MTVENRMYRAAGLNPYVAGQPAHQKLADLARTPVRLVAFQIDNQSLNLKRQLIGVTHRAA